MSTGRFSLHSRFGPQLAVETLRAATGHEYYLDDLLDGPTAASSRWRPIFAT